MSMVDIVVVVVTFNSADVIDDLLASLPAGMANLDYHVVVADNASSDATVAHVRAMCPSAVVVETGRNAGYAAGINAALADAPPYTAALILNPDVRLTPGAVPPLFEALKDPAVGIAVPRLLDAQGRLIPSQRREPTVLRAWGDALVGGALAGRFAPLGEMVTDPREYDRPADPDWVEGSTMLIGAECLQECGPWDESFFLYSEETEFALRAKDAGFGVRFVPRATATHLQGGHSAGLWTLLVLNRLRLYRRRHGLLPSLAFWGAMLVREASRALLGRPVSRASARALISPSRLRAKPGPKAVARFA